MTTKQEWWLIHNKTVDIIREALEAPTHSLVHHCRACHPGLVDDDCIECQGDKQRQDALHELDLGLHVTEAIPWDEPQVMP